MYRGRDGYSML